jgi:nucleoid-associated protein YgaU
MAPRCFVLDANFWELLGKDTMRYVLATSLAAAMICAGCPKPESPKVEPAPPPMKPTATTTSPRPLVPLEGEPGTTPTTISRPTPLVGPETTIKPAKEPSVTPAPAGTTAVGPSPTAAPGGVYVVKKGDTLWRIATAVYGDGKRHKDIAAANPGIDPNKLKPGQKLVMPK